MKKRLSRREILTTLGVAGVTTLGYKYFSTPITQLAQSIARTLIQDAKSKHLQNTLSVQPARRFFQVNLGGAPSRWFFDHLLKPTDAHEIIPHPVITTELLPQNPNDPFAFNSKYSTVKKFGYNVPILWNEDVAASDGGMRPMDELLKHMLMLRGLHMKIDGHPINTARQVAAIEGEPSVTGFVADMTNAYFPSISIGRSPANRAFFAPSGVGLLDIPVDLDNYVDFLLESFYDDANKKDSHGLDSAIDMTQQIVDAYSNTNLTGSSILYNERQRAHELIKKKFKSFGEVFDQLTSKYEDLFKRSMENRNIRNITDIPYRFPGFPFSLKGDIETREAIGQFTVDAYYIESDVRDIFKTAKRKVMAKQFALAEFCLTEGLSGSILIAAPDETWNFLDSPTEFSGGSIAKIKKHYDKEKNLTTYSLSENYSKESPMNGILMDTHNVGVLANFHACNQFYLGLSSALLELIDQLKKTKVDNTNLFNETVIHLASEFEREPDQNFAGTSHSYRAGVSSFLSGIISETTLVGNIYIGKPDGKRPGTRGDAAPIEALDNETANYQHLSSTTSELLRIPKVVKRAESLVSVKGDKIASIIEPPKNVVGIEKDT